VLDVRARPGTNGRARRHGTPTSVGREHKRAHGSNATKFENIHIHTGEILFLCVRCLRAFFFFFFFFFITQKHLTHPVPQPPHPPTSSFFFWGVGGRVVAACLFYFFFFFFFISKSQSS